jgi:hypothetical protein
LAPYGNRIKVGEGRESIGSDRSSSANNQSSVAKASLFGEHDTSKWDTYMAGVRELERNVDGKVGGDDSLTEQDLDSFIDQEFGQD